MAQATCQFFILLLNKKAELYPNNYIWNDNCLVLSQKALENLIKITNNLSLRRC